MSTVETPAMKHTLTLSIALLLVASSTWSQMNHPYEWPDNQPAAGPFPQSEEITKIVFSFQSIGYEIS